MSLAGRHVVLGVSGGIACYKSCTLARRLAEDGATVDVVLTASAAAFVRPLTFEALLGRPVLASLWEKDRALAHIALAKEPDLVIIAPATAHLVARAAMGMADDLLTALLLARTGPVLCAPAMNDDMYAHPATQQNHPSSGRMGFALAQAAVARGADVILITGPTDLTPPSGVTVHRVETTVEMQRAVEAAVPQAQLLLMAAAPADYRPTVPLSTKQPRANGRITVELEATPDILGSLKRPKQCVVVGFALETGNGLERARGKLREKDLDYIILNDALEPGAGFEVSTNRVTIVPKRGEPVRLPLLPKRDVAEKILDAVEQALS